MGHSCHAYDLVDGYFASLDTEGKLLILQLPSDKGHTVVPFCERTLVSRPADFAIDPTLDLIVFLTVEDGGESKYVHSSSKTV